MDRLRIPLMLLILVSAALAGCQQPESVDPSPEVPAWEGDEFPLPVQVQDESGCIDVVCVLPPGTAPPPGLDHNFTGWERLVTQYGNINRQTLSIEAGWLVWQAINIDIGRSHIMALDLDSRELLGLSVGPGEAQRPFVDVNGEVVFTYGSANYTGLAHWSPGDMEVHKLLPPRGNASTLLGFSGDWVATINTDAGQSYAAAWNMETGEEHVVYDEGQEQRGEKFGGVTVGGGFVASIVRTERAFYADVTNLTTGESHRWTMPQASPRATPTGIFLMTRDEYGELDPETGEIDSLGVRVPREGHVGSTCGVATPTSSAVLFDCRDDDGHFMRYYWFHNQSFVEYDQPTQGKTLLALGIADEEYMLQLWSWSDKEDWQTGRTAYDWYIKKAHAPGGGT